MLFFKSSWRSWMESTFRELCHFFRQTAYPKSMSIGNTTTHYFLKVWTSRRAVSNFLRRWKLGLHDNNALTTTAANKIKKTAGRRNQTHLASKLCSCTSKLQTCFTMTPRWKTCTWFTIRFASSNFKRFQKEGPHNSAACLCHLLLRLLPIQLQHHSILASRACSTSAHQRCLCGHHFQAPVIAVKGHE